MLVALALGACSGGGGGQDATDDPQAAPMDPLRVGLTTGPAVVLGDSFASGEGAGGYLPGDSAVLEACHRSDAATGVVAAVGAAEAVEASPTASPELSGGVALNVACSGALTEHVTAASRAGVPAQLDQLGDVVPGAAIVTTGGNDIGFVDLVGECALAEASCAGQPALREATFAAIGELEGELVDAYRAVDAALNTEAMRAARDGAVAPVIVVPYPQLLPESAQVLCLGFDDDELVLAREIVGGLNDAIEAAVTAASGDGRAVYLVDGVEDAFAGRTACSGDPLVHWPASPADVLELLQDPEALGRELLHPTAQGYAALADVVVPWSAAEPLAVAQADSVVAQAESVLGSGEPVAADGDGDGGGGEKPWTATYSGWLRVVTVLLALGAVAWVVLSRRRLERGAARRRP